jgi:hypothetical protein
MELTALALANPTAPGTGYRVPGTEGAVGGFTVPGPRSPVPDTARWHVAGNGQVLQGSM